jgi:hypothetical protein
MYGLLAMDVYCNKLRDMSALPKAKTHIVSKELNKHQLPYKIKLIKN